MSESLKTSQRWHGARVSLPPGRHRRHVEVQDRQGAVPSHSGEIRRTGDVAPAPYAYGCRPPLEPQSPMGVCTAALFCGRASLGVLPVQRLNAWVNALTSWKPRSHAISEIAKSLSFKYRLARSALSSVTIPAKVVPSRASRRESVRGLVPSQRAISPRRAFPCGS